LTHPNIQIPRVGKYYSANHGYFNYWDEPTQKSAHSFNRPTTDRAPRPLRYVGSLVADFHRTLLKGGVFFYPEDSKHPNGKLRLMYEASPMAFLAEQAGGKATDGKMRILDKVPPSVHVRTPLIIGSADDVDQVMDMYKEMGKI
ncbi:MAG: class 1 fructose-bisphosphatase, partial [Mailhella sp.]|nr:class 1 fructose-bisphosphatase [Mailhella sp.]